MFVPLPFRSTKLPADPGRTLFFSSGTMVSKIFHPNVSKQGEICVDTLKKGWTPETGISHILSVSAPDVLKPRHVSLTLRLPFLQVIRCLLIAPNPESALDEEAGKLLLEAYED